MEQNFMKKLGEKWADFKFGNGKMARKVAALILAGAMAVPMLLSAAACEFVVHKNPNGDIVVTPNDDASGGNQQGTQSGGEDKTEPDYSMYSDILQTVLTSEYYKDFAEKAINKELGTTLVDGRPTFDDGNNLIEPVPYNFLQNEGIDINKIKSGDIRVDAISYVSDNKTELYHKVDVTFQGNNNVTTQYLLKYKINEKEYNDLTMLNKNQYVQAPLFIQELDNQREPEVVSKFNIYEESYNQFLDALNQSKRLKELFNNSKITSYNITSVEPCDNGDYLLDVNLMSSGKATCSLYTAKYSHINILLYNLSHANYNNSIFYMDRPSYWFEDTEELQSITCFDPDYSRIQANSITKTE